MTGGSGFVGKALIHRLIAKGERVKVLLRPSSRFEIEHPLIEKIIGDIRDRRSFEGALADVEKIYHLAGVVTDWAPRKLYEEVHIKGTRNILDAAIAAGVNKIIYISTVDVLDYDRNSVLDEATNYTFSVSPYRFTKVQAEKMVLENHKENKIKAVVIRPSWVYGPGDNTFLPEIAYQIKKGSMVFIGSGDNLLPLVYIDNLVTAIINAGEIEAAKGRTFIISDGEITWKELVNSIAHSINGRATKLCLPYWDAYYTAFAMELVSGFVSKKHRPLLTRAVVEMMGRSIKLDVRGSKDTLGYESSMSLDEGLTNALQWLKTDSIKELRRK